jgi:hypothetical protein
MSVRVITAASGGWAVIASGGRTLIVDALDDRDFVESAWAAVQLPTGFQSLLDLLTARGLVATPAFALVEWLPGGDPKVILRGDSPLQMTGTAGVDQVSAAGVSTWVERILVGLDALAFTVPGAVPVPGAKLPLESGVAAVAAVTIGVTAEVGVVTRPAPAARAVPPVVPAVPAAESAARASLPEPIDVDLGTTMASLPDRDTAQLPPQQSEPDAAGSYDFLFGDTIVRSVADAAVLEPDVGEETAASDPLAGDHDGHTVLTSDIAKLRGSRKSRSSANAPPTPPPTPALVLVVSSTGMREPLEQPILVGRSPSVSRVSGGQIPRLITIVGTDQDISRNHLQVALEGGTVVVTDLHSRNGTAVVLPGKDSQKLRPGEPTAVIVGTVIDLGGGITLTVEEQ